MKDIKNILELIAGLKELGLVAKAALKDGKVDLQDLSLLAGLLSKQAVLTAALEGLAELDDEVKDLSLDEGLQIVQALVLAAKEVKAA